MNFKYYTDLGIYEGDILYAGGKVDYTGEVIYNGFGYRLEKAIISLEGFELQGYMKRFNSGNAVLCLYSSKGKEFTKQEWKAKRAITKILRDKEKKCVDFYEFRGVRDILLFLTTLVGLGTIIMGGLCFELWISGFEQGCLCMMLVCFGALLLMLYMRRLCKSLDLISYKAKLFTQEDLEKLERIYDDKKDED